MRDSRSWVIAEATTTSGVCGHAPYASASKHTNPKVLRSPVSAVHLGIKAIVGEDVESGNAAFSPYLLAIYACG